jgi:hypothetical protein
MDPGSGTTHDAKRRALLVKAAYVAPAILSLQAAPRYAKAGSSKPGLGPDPNAPPRWANGPPK